MSELKFVKLNYEDNLDVIEDVKEMSNLEIIGICYCLASNPYIRDDFEGVVENVAYINNKLEVMDAYPVMTHDAEEEGVTYYIDNIFLSGCNGTDIFCIAYTDEGCEENKSLLRLSSGY